MRRAFRDFAMEHEQNEERVTPVKSRSNAVNQSYICVNRLRVRREKISAVSMGGGRSEARVNNSLSVRSDKWENTGIYV